MYMYSYYHRTTVSGNKFIYSLPETVVDGNLVEIDSDKKIVDKK